MIKQKQMPIAGVRHQHRIGLVTIAPGITVTTIPGSMYATILKVLGSLGHLDRHDYLFTTFLRTGTLAAAHQLLQQIGVSRTEMEEYVRADEEFFEHCAKRTQEYRKLAARGNKKYQRILKNTKICDKRGRWIGDMNEGVSILSGARTLAQVKKGKNLRILHKAHLMFDTMVVGTEQFCFLYPQKFHRAFLKATSLVHGDNT